MRRAPVFPTAEESCAWAKTGAPGQLRGVGRGKAGRSTEPRALEKPESWASSKPQGVVQTFFIFYMCRDVKKGRKYSIHMKELLFYSC